jgi:HK97 family phage portal protein
MQVPAFSRGVRLISGTVAQLPLTEWDGATDRTRAFLDQPEPDRPRWVTMQRLTRDLILFGVAFWEILAVNDGKVTLVRSRDAAAVTVDKDRTRVTGDYWADGARVSNPTTRPVVGDVILFDGFRDGVLATGQSTIDTAIALEAASATYANTPAPTQILKNTSNYELDDTEITEMLDAYTAARQASSVAYLNGGVDLTTFGYSAQDLQLVEARNQSAIEIARLLGLDPFWVGASLSGSSLVYTNRVDIRADLVTLTLTDYMLPIEQRISMADVLGGAVRFDASEFLRANLDTRARMAIDLFTAGVIDRDEARAFVSDEPTGGPA